MRKLPQKTRNRAKPLVEMLEGRTLLSAAGLSVPMATPTFRLAHQDGLLPASTTAPTGVTPTQMRHAYGVDTVTFGSVTGNGAGQTIGIVDAYDDPNALSDLQHFDSYFGLPDPPSFTKLNEDGGASLPGTDPAPRPNTWELEESLDIEWAHVIAPQASIVLYEANSASFGDLIQHAANTARNNPNVNVVSMSFDTGEFNGETSYDSYFTTPAGHVGVTFVASTGDNGSPGGYPAYAPNVVAIGGTTLSIDSSGNYISESGWSGSGGGKSLYEPEPTYQNSVQSNGIRETPDVSMDASPSSGVPVYDTYDGTTHAPWLQVGGTSLAAPMWAGLIAIADQGRGTNGLSSLDGQSQTLPLLYGTAAANYHDVTTGSNGGFTAGPGYDLVTGRGTPIANTLIPTLIGTPSSPANSASFLRSDTSTGGTWTGVYGADGYWDFNGPSALPSYAQVTPSGQQSWTWSSSTTDPRALQTAPNSSSRLAAAFFSASSFSLDVNLSDGKAHQVALYMLDWDTSSRVQSVTVTDAASGATLDSHTVSNFHNGQWLVWNITGHVKITLTWQAGYNAVAMGIMFGPAQQISTSGGTASYVRSDTFTQGTWTGTYGSDGFWDFASTSSLPAYAQITPSGQQSWTWASSSTDPRALQTSAGSSSRVASCFFTPGGSGTSYSLDVNLTDGKAHQVALYLLDWDSQGRTESVQVLDGATAAVLDTRSVSNFSGGQWLVWNLTGHVTINVTCTAGVNGVASGIMFDPVSSSSSTGGTAAFSKSDTSTAGTWTGVYGADGYLDFNAGGSLPNYAQLSASNQQNWTWASSTTDPRALQTAPGSSSRVAACLFTPGGAGTSFTLDVNLTDGKAHQVALYMMDWDNQGRVQGIQVLDGASSAVLDTRSISNFYGGQWLVWNITGHVKIVVTCTSGINAVASGIMFAPAA